MVFLRFLKWFWLVLFQGVVEFVHELAGGNEDEKDPPATGSRMDDRGSLVGTCWDIGLGQVLYAEPWKLII